MEHTLTITSDERELLARLLKREYDELGETLGALPVGVELQLEIKELHDKVRGS